MIQHKRNILRVWNRASEEDRARGETWYPLAHATCEYLALRYSIPLPSVVGVLAVLSPGRDWDMNQHDTDVVLKAYTGGESLPLVGSYGRANVNKAYKILAKQDYRAIGGPKVRSFYACILRPHSTLSVCIDRHAISVCLNRVTDGKDVGLGKLRQYEYFAGLYRDVAHTLNIQPMILQATCWVTWRRLHGSIEQQDIPF